VQHSKNHPAISEEWAMQRYPNARNAERDELIKLAPLFPGCRVIDIQSAGGFLSDGIYDALQGNVELVCIEPVKALNQRLNLRYQVIEDPIEKWSSVSSDSADIAVGLAGLHHSQDQQATINESFRTLKPGGYFAVCDVIDHSAIANWLNDYVHKNNTSGHIGNFLSRGEVSAMMKNSGFTNIQESIKSVPWVLPNKDHTAIFFKGLFGLKTEVDDIKKAISTYLILTETKDKVINIEWNLIYAIGQKPF